MQNRYQIDFRCVSANNSLRLNNITIHQIGSDRKTSVCFPWLLSSFLRRKEVKVDPHLNIHFILLIRPVTTRRARFTIYFFHRRKVLQAGSWLEPERELHLEHGHGVIIFKLNSEPSLMFDWTVSKEYPTETTKSELIMRARHSNWSRGEWEERDPEREIWKWFALFIPLIAPTGCISCPETFPDEEEKLWISVMPGDCIVEANFWGGGDLRILYNFNFPLILFWKFGIKVYCGI